MAKRPSKPSANQGINPLVDAVRFVSLVTKDEGAPYEIYSIMYQGQLIAHNGTIGAGHKMPENLHCAPHTNLFREALSKCGEAYSLELTDKGLQIKSGKFKAVVPCADYLEGGVSYIPDPPMYSINDTFVKALQAVGVLTNEAGQHIVTASILMNQGSLIASDLKIIFEYWHGLELPYGASLPKAVVGPLAKSSKKLVKFGFSNSSVTFYFEDESWLKSQIYADRWPDIQKVLNKKANMWPVPTGFWEALEAVAPFSKDGLVYFAAGRLASHRQEGAGASFDVPGLPAGPIFSARSLRLIQPYAEQIDFAVEGDKMLMFKGQNIRGAIAGIG